MTERQKFHKDRFDVITQEKQLQIINAAIDEFAECGFNGTSINKVAKRAKISIGAMYSYFESKDELFLTVVGHLLHILKKALDEVDQEGNILDTIKSLFYKAHDYAVLYPQANQIYMDFSTHSLSNLSNRVSKDLETITKNLYVQVLEKAKDKGQLDENIDLAVLSFMLDNMMMMYQFSWTSDYYKERMKIFIGNTDDHHKQIEEMVKIIEKAIKP